MQRFILNTLPKIIWVRWKKMPNGFNLKGEKIGSLVFIRCSLGE